MHSNLSINQIQLYCYLHLIDKFAIFFLPFSMRIIAPNAVTRFVFLFCFSLLSIRLCLQLNHLSKNMHSMHVPILMRVPILCLYGHGMILKMYVKRRSEWMGAWARACTKAHQIYPIRPINIIILVFISIAYMISVVVWCWFFAACLFVAVLLLLLLPPLLLCCLCSLHVLCVL